MKQFLFLFSIGLFLASCTQTDYSQYRKALAAVKRADQTMAFNVHPKRWSGFVSDPELKAVMRSVREVEVLVVDGKPKNDRYFDKRMSRLNETVTTLAKEPLLTVHSATDLIQIFDVPLKENRFIAFINSKESLVVVEATIILENILDLLENRTAIEQLVSEL